MTRVTMQDYEEQDYAVGRSYLCWGSWEGEARTYRKGYFRSFDGIVDIYQSRLPKWTCTSIRFIHQGRDHSRRWPTVWGDKTVARLAREFVEEIVGGGQC